MNIKSIILSIVFASIAVSNSAYAVFGFSTPTDLTQEEKDQKAELHKAISRKDLQIKALENAKEYHKDLLIRTITVKNEQGEDEPLILTFDEVIGCERRLYLTYLELASLKAKRAQSQAELAILLKKELTYLKSDEKSDKALIAAVENDLKEHSATQPCCTLTRTSATGAAVALIGAAIVCASIKYAKSKNDKTKAKIAVKKQA